MLSILVALVLLAICVGAIYLLLKNMGEDGVEVAAPGSCKSGNCGVRRGASPGTACHREEALPDEADEIGRLSALEPQRAAGEQQGRHTG
jgi:hypothetical protein